MKNSNTFFSLILIAVVITNNVTIAQVINVNPDPDGEPWIAGDALATPPEIEATIPFMTLSSASAATDLPASVDNSELIYMLPVFDQGASYSCVQVAETWYTFGYEINRLRNAYPGEIVGDTNYWQNQFHPFYTYNFCNQGSGQNETSCKSGFNIIKGNGCPSYDVYEDPALHNGTSDKYLYWMNGYENYKSGLHNKISSIENIAWDSSYASLDLLKHWLSDHNSGDATGGLAIIVVLFEDYSYSVFPPGTPEASKKYILQWGTSGGHALTIVGYNDSVQCFDLDSNAVYINSDIDGDGIIELSECELGAFKVVNSWGTETFGDDGYIFVPYKLMAEGLQVEETAYVCHAIEDNTPILTIKTSVEHTGRKTLQYRVGYANNAEAVSPVADTSFRCFSFQGGENEMRGAYSGPIETALDFGHFYGNQDFGKIYFVVNNHDAFHYFEGILESFSIIDYRWDQEFELEFPQSSVPINDLYFNTFSINYDLIVPGDNQVINTNDTLFSDMVSRFNPVVTNNSTMLVENGVSIDMYNSDIAISEGSSLTLEDCVTITAKRDTCRIIIDGNINLGKHINFVAEDSAVLEIRLNNGDLQTTFDSCYFERCRVFNYGSELDVENCDFKNCPWLLSFNGDVFINKCNFDNTAIYVANPDHSDYLTTISNCELI